ncbi:hypothetical protein HAX54_031338, partial [Datura stramonium]|nr:hypothetical protein [Datura stramonium]
DDWIRNKEKKNRVATMLNWRNAAEAIDRWHVICESPVKTSEMLAEAQGEGLEASSHCPAPIAKHQCILKGYQLNTDNFLTCSSAASHELPPAVCLLSPRGVEVDITLAAINALFWADEIDLGT